MTSKMYKFSLLVVVVALILGANAFLNQSVVHATLGSTAYQTVPYDASNFGATNGAFWFQPTNGHTPANVNTFRYNVNSDKKMHIMFDALDGVTGGNLMNSFMTVKIPEGRVSMNTTTVPIMCRDLTSPSGNYESCYMIETFNSNLLLIRRTSEANWSANNHMRITFNTEIEVSDAQ